MKVSQRKSFLTIIACALLSSGCSISGSIEDLSKVIFPSTDETLNRETPDFTSGQIVTTAQGYQFKALFGETAEKQTVNGYEIMAVIHE